MTDWRFFDWAPGGKGAEIRFVIEEIYALGSLQEADDAVGDRRQQRSTHYRHDHLVWFEKRW